MIRNSFCFLQGIGLKSEQNIWNQGITSWNSFLASSKIKGISGKKKFYYNNRINSAKKALFDNDSSHFLSFPSTETWRLYNWFNEDAVYVDIETGFANTQGRSSITVVTLYDGQDTKTFVKGINLYRSALKQELERYKLIITFNGSSFDLPVIKKHFALTANVPHLDLRFACEQAGLFGGLKQIEKETGIKRSADACGIRGNDAAYMWKMWHSTRKKAYLQKLVAYNQEDAANLEPLAKKVVSCLSSKLQAKIRKKQ